MSFSSRLIHTLTIERGTEIGDSDWGQAEEVFATSATVQGLPQPKTIREMALTTDAGAVVGDWTIFLPVVPLHESDRIIHDPVTCTVRGVRDLPAGTFQPTGIRNAAGIGHHLEVDATLVAATVAEAS